MKKLLSTLLCLSVMTGIVPLSSSAVSEPIYIEDGAESWSKTVISGDINDDGQVSMSDLVILHRYFMNGNIPSDDDYEDSADIMKERLDINFDGCFDIFDMVQMRQTVLHPETALTQTWAIDAFNSDINFSVPETLEDVNTVLTSYDEMSAYLSTITTNSDEIQKYLDRYNETFFEENNLILEPFIQERGNGVFYEVSAAGRFNNMHRYGGIFNGILFAMTTCYQQDICLYPVTNAPMLAQVTVPKSQSSADDKTGGLDVSKFFEPDMSTCSYTSPDGEKEIYITQKSFLLAGDVNLYLKNPDGSFTYLTYLATDDGCQPFGKNGEWSVDEEGNNVFSDGERYSITWKPDGVVLDHLIDCGVWENIFVSFDGETIQRESYDKYNK